MQTRLTPCSWLAIVACLLPLARASAQQAQPAESVRGRITDDSSHAIALATVMVTRGPDRLTLTATTDSLGNYRVKFDQGQLYIPILFTTSKAFGAFSDAWSSGERAMRDDRFWTGWRLVSERVAAPPGVCPFELECDEWGAYRLVDMTSDEVFRLAARGVEYCHRHLADTSVDIHRHTRRLR